MNFSKLILICTILFVANQWVWSQTYGYSFENEEAQLAILFDELNQAVTDEDKLNINHQILEHLEDILYDDKSFTYQFTQIKSLGILNSDDKLVRIYNWNILFENRTNRYYGFIQYLLKRKNEILIYRLIDRSDEIHDPELKSLNHENWYGALYYDILTRKYKKEMSYTLLGWDGNDGLSKRKIIDVLTFTSNGKPRFASSAFEMTYVRNNGIKRTRMQKRIIFEYSARASMMLRWDNDKKMIVFDHLVPMQDYYKDNFQFYGPDMTHDALMFKKGTWIHIEDADVRREKKTKTETWKYNPSEEMYRSE